MQGDIRKLRADHYKLEVFYLAWKNETKNKRTYSGYMQECLSIRGNKRSFSGYT